MVAGCSLHFPPLLAPSSLSTQQRAYGCDMPRNRIIGILFLIAAIGLIIWNVLH